MEPEPAGTPPPAGQIDARGDRLAQGGLAVLLLAAFVFRLPWLVPVLALLVAFGAIAGPRFNPFHSLFHTVLGRRFPASEGMLPAATVRAQDTCSAGACALAALTFLIGFDGLGWLIVIVVAVVAIVAATTRVHLGARLMRRVAR